MDYNTARRMEKSHRCAACKAPLVTIWRGNEHCLVCGQHREHMGYRRIPSLTEEWDEGAALPADIGHKLEKKYGRKPMTEQIADKGLTIRPLKEPVPMEELGARVKDLDRFYRSLMQEGTDYGIIPGTLKPSLWKPGAELLRLWAGLTPLYENDDSRSDRKAGYIHWLSTCRLLNRAGETVGELSGSCNSHEAKYRWRWVREWELPQGVDKATLASKVINNKGDIIYRLGNDNPADLDNTLLRMAQKRAFIGGILMVTGASRIFTQKVEEDEAEEGNGAPESAPGAPPQPEARAPSASKPAPAKAVPAKPPRASGGAIEPNTIGAIRYWAKQGGVDGEAMAQKHGAKGVLELTEAQGQEILKELRA